MIGVAFDVDGVLINSYRGVEDFYRKTLSSILGISRELIEYIVEYEYIGELVGLLREDWWLTHIPGLTEQLYDELITRYWEHRISGSVLEPGVEYVLEALRRRGFKVFSVSYRDDIYGLKKYRIQYFGLEKYFDEVLVAGEDVPDRYSGLNYLVEKYGLEKIVYVDDKPLNLYKLLVKGDRRIVLVHYRFKHNRQHIWRDPGGVFKSVENLYELINLLDELGKD